MNSRTIRFALAFVSFGATSASADGIVNGDFESGNTGFSSEYYAQSQCAYGAYTVGTSSLAFCGDFAVAVPDHTTGTGSMLLADGSDVADTVLWSQTVKVTPGTNYEFTFWATSIDQDSFTTDAPSIQVYVNGKPLGRALALKPHYDGKWRAAHLRWNSKTSTQATFWLVDLTAEGIGNDYAVDDISLTAQ
jgi:hypothetical protein